jgi:hypothetical protein
MSGHDEHGHDPGHHHGHQHGHQHDQEGPADERRRAFVSKVVDRIVADPQFRQHVKEDPRGALEAAGLSDEYEQLKEAGPGQPGRVGGW